MTAANERRISHFRLGLAIFAYTAVISAFIQLVLLPNVFPAWHAGHGLIAGGDMPSHHALAVQQAELIKDQGWSAWTLRPDGQAPAGIASALYVLIAPEPWTMIPLHAALHAAAGVLIYAILMRFWPHPRAALVAASPLVLFPSAALWYSQLGKDGFSVAGYLAILSGWMLLVRIPGRLRLRHFALVVGLISGGAGLVWVVRPYAVEIILVLSVIAAAVAVGVLLLHRRRSGLTWPWFFRGSVSAAVALLVVWLLAGGGYEPQTPPSGNRPTTQPGPAQSAAGDPAQAPLELALADEPFVGSVVWYRSSWLPEFVDDRLYSLAVARIGFTKLFPLAASNIDENVQFNGAVGILRYVPRATAIALFYPTPPQWFGEGSLPQNTLMRRIAGAEMLVVYLGLALLPFAVVRWRRRVDVWVLILFSFGMLVVHGLVVANIGTLYRMRYPYLMSLVCLGLLAGWAALSDRRVRRSRTESPLAMD